MVKISIITDPEGSVLTHWGAAPILFGSTSVQHECIPQAILGMDVICQAKSGMGKTAVFVLSSLQQIDPVAGHVAALVLCHTRELAYQVCNSGCLHFCFVYFSLPGLGLLIAVVICRYAMSSRGSANISLN
jgi:hypothetical protein